MTVKRLSPHALAHFKDDWCNRCWWLAMNHQIKPPSMPFPRVLNIADEQMKKAFLGQRLDWLGIPGTVRTDKKTWVLSRPAEVSGGQIEIGGFPDAIADLDDGSVAVIDYKMSEVKESNAIRYEPQLNAYKYALENPSDGLPLNVTQLWLVVWTPGQMAVSPDEMHPQPFMGSLSSMQVQVQDGLIERLMETHGKLLFGPVPLPSGSCEMCSYMSQAARKVQELREQREKVPA